MLGFVPQPNLRIKLGEVATTDSPRITDKVTAVNPILMSCCGLIMGSFLYCCRQFMGKYKLENLGLFE